MVKATVTVRSRIPEDVYSAVTQKHEGQRVVALIADALVPYISDPEAIAGSTFYHFKESGDKSSQHDITLELSAADRKQFGAVAKALNVTQRDLISNALIERFDLDMKKIPYASSQRSLAHDREEIAKLSKVKKIAAPATEPETPLVRGYTMGELNRIIAETGDRSTYVTAGRNAEREARRRVSYIIPEWKK